MVYLNSMNGNKKKNVHRLLLFIQSQVKAYYSDLNVHFQRKLLYKKYSRKPLTHNSVPNLPILNIFPRPTYTPFPLHFSTFHLSSLPCSPVYPHLNLSHHSKTLSPPSLHSKAPFFNHLFLLHSPPLTRKKRETSRS